METIYCNKRGKCKKMVLFFNMELMNQWLDKEKLFFIVKAFNLKLE